MRTYDRDSGKQLLLKEEIMMINVLPSDLPLQSYLWAKALAA